jgi:hypothetical protein
MLISCSKAGNRQKGNGRAMKDRHFFWMRIVCLCMAGFCLCARVEGKTWHVSQKELTGIGKEQQVRTIGEAVSLVKPGDKVIIHNGIYREKVVIEKSGLPDRPIKFYAAVGANVIVTGADRITDWHKEDSDVNIFSTDWPHRFVTHPNDDFHHLIGRCEQVFVDGYALRQILSFNKLSRGTFFVDLDAKRLYAWAANNKELSDRKNFVEASVRSQIWMCKGAHVHIKGIRFRYATNPAQKAAVVFSGNHDVVEDCQFEYFNASGARFTGENITVRNCIFQYNGQMGFGAGRAHNLLMTGCIIRNNNIKGYMRGWEAGGNKIVLTRGAVIENSVIVENRGNGIWFDIGNENNVVRNCLIANNEDSGIYYEISYGLHAHDNVIIGNGFAHHPDAWGARAGISISSSPNCVIERNLILGNKEGFNFREQTRSTPRIDKKSEPVWNHDHIIRNNVIAYNRDAQTWGWFDIRDSRHWPARDGKAKPNGLTLEKLSLAFNHNLYSTGPGQGLFNWGVPWQKHKKYRQLDDVRNGLNLEQGSKLVEIIFKDFSNLDFRVPVDSLAIKMHCYPRGEVPGVKLGTYHQ